MKLICFHVFGFSLLCSFFPVTASETIQDQIQDQIQDHGLFKSKETWSIIPLPVAGYTTEKGLSLGTYFEVTKRGENDFSGRKYLHKITADLGYYSNKSGYFHMVYNSNYLIHKIKTTLSFSYLSDKILPFYGYNGYKSLYHTDFPESYYSHQRDLLRAVADFQGEILPGIYWMGGLSYYRYSLGSSSETENSLYDLYVDSGLIRATEKKGGEILYVKAGLSYDTRDQIADPTSGLFSEILFSAAPGLTSEKGDGHLKLTMVFRQYANLWRKKMILAFRLAYQGNLAGNPPFYVQNNIQTLNIVKAYNDGIGGVLSVRGVLPNRIVGNGMAWGNVELRFRITPFRLIKKEWYLSANPFFDSGMVVQAYREGEMNLLDPDHFTPGKETLHCSAGIGLKAVMENHFVISGEFGKTLDRRDGNCGVYFGLNYLF